MACVALVPNAQAAGPAEEKQACIADHVKAQELNKDDKLKSALERAAACSREVCPSPVRKACSALAEAIEASMPSVIVVVATASGSEKPGQLEIDGAPVDAGESDKPIELDPGNHSFRAKVGDRFVEKSVLVISGKKRVIVRLDAPVRSEGTQPRAAIPERDTEPTPRVTTPVIVLGAVGVLGIASFSYFGLQGRSKQNDLESCKPNCDPSLRDPVRRDYLIADVSLLVGAAALGTAAWLYFSQHTTAATTAAGGRQRPARAPRWFLRASPVTRQIAGGAEFW